MITFENNKIQEQKHFAFSKNYKKNYKHTGRVLRYIYVYMYDTDGSQY